MNNNKKPREWILTDGIISWSYGKVHVVEYSAYKQALEKIARLELALQECEKIFNDPVCSSYKAIAHFEGIKKSILEDK